ncbi:MAG: hypothetical protein M3179_12120 [Actinomycetota bacterium]|nr:hypothetical protein [Actinomycetota bacterium]
MGRGKRGLAFVTVLGALLGVVALPPSPAGAAPAEITTVAGGVSSGPARSLNQSPAGIALRGSSLYITDWQRAVVREVDLATGFERVIVGNGAPGFSGDGGPAVAAQLNTPVAIVVDAAGNLFIGDDGNDRIRKVDTNGIITTHAGGGTGPGLGDGGPATAARLTPSGLDFGPDGSLYVVSFDRIRRIDPSGIITTMAGGGQNPVTEGALATTVYLRDPSDVAVDESGNLYIADQYANAVRKVTPLGTIHTDDAAGDMNLPSAVEIDGAGNLYVAWSYDRIHRRSPAGEWTLFAGNGVSGELGDGRPAIEADLGTTSDLLADAAGNIWLNDGWVRRIDPAGILSNVAGNDDGTFNGEGVPATSAELWRPWDVTFDPAGNLLIADGNARVRKVDGAGIITTLIGEDHATYGPGGITTDATGHIWVSWYEGISRFDPTGRWVSGFAFGPGGFWGDGGPASEAGVKDPRDLVVDAAGNVYFADTGNHRIRKIDTAGIISTVFMLNHPRALDMDAAGNLYAVGAESDSVLKWEPSSGRVTHLGQNAFSLPWRLDVDPAGTLYVSQQLPRPIVRIDRSGAITYVAGTTQNGFSGDGGPAIKAQLNMAAGLATDSAGNLFIADSENHRIRRVSSPGLPSTIRGSGWNGIGQLGNGSTVDSATPVTAAGPTGMMSVSAGGYHSLALRSDGTVWAWGWNGYGQLGTGSRAHSFTPVPVPGLTDVVAIAAGWLHSVALKADGTVWTWGWNFYGQLGNGSNADSWKPVKVPNLSNVTSVAAGLLHTMARDEYFNVAAWGSNGYGQLGNGTILGSSRPVVVKNLDALAIAAGGYHSVAIRADGSVAAWGLNANGQLGDGSTSNRSFPVAVPGLTDVGQVSAGMHHSLALKRDGTVLGWGWNRVGVVGDGTTLDRKSPVVVTGLGAARAISAGGTHSVAVLADGRVMAWGWNAYGQLGDGSTVTRLQPVAATTPGSGWDASAGLLHTLVL